MTERTMSKTELFEKENAAASEAIAIYTQRLADAFGTIERAIDVLRGTHVHHATVAAPDGTMPCMLRVTFDWSDDAVDVLRAIATATK